MWTPSKRMCCGGSSVCRDREAPKVELDHMPGTTPTVDALNVMSRLLLLENLSWRSTMNWDRIQGNWKQLRGVVREQWGKLTDDDLDRIAGKRDQLIGRLQERYGIAKDEAERQIDHWLKNQPVESDVD